MARLQKMNKEPSEGGGTVVVHMYTTLAKARRDPELTRGLLLVRGSSRGSLVQALSGQHVTDIIHELHLETFHQEKATITI